MIKKFLPKFCIYLTMALPAAARTVIIDANEADQMAVISAVAPRMSWAACETSSAVYTTSSIDLVPGRSFLIRFALNQIPSGQRITFAELILPVQSCTGTDPRFYLWRVLAEWGAGVSHLYRRTSPGKVEWAVPGARGLSADRSTRPSAVVRVKASGEQVINVTNDLELWHIGAAPNFGWLITIEDPALFIRFASPAWNALADWKLRITYEPE
ncbi:MAG: hypothetical protein HYV36_06280 [Lentisphaerae bacterium]|nr:hypothetical protein [Lentisphaerota bacterium]